MKLSTLFLAYDRALLNKGTWASQRYAFFRGTMFPDDPGAQSPKGRLGMYHIATDKDKYARKWQRADRQARSLGRRILARLAELEGGPAIKMPIQFRELPK